MQITIDVPADMSVEDVVILTEMFRRDVRLYIIMQGLKSLGLSIDDMRHLLDNHNKKLDSATES